MDKPEKKQVRVDSTSKAHAENARSLRQRELYTASDRVCAIVWGATIHDLLKTAVRDRLIKNLEHASRLFGGDGPLANFSVLHNLAHAMGFIGVEGV